MRINVLKANGDLEIHDFETEPTLEQLQRMVGGFIEIVPGFNKYLGADCEAYCNEDGIRLNLPRNEQASRQWRLQLHGRLQQEPRLLGDIVIVMSAMLENAEVEEQDESL